MKLGSTRVARTVVHVGLAFSLALAPHQSVLAQRAQADTVPVRVLLSFVFTELAPAIAGRVRSAPAAPWRIELPRSNAWAGVSDGFTRILQSRPPTTADREQQYLVIGQTAASDTDRVFDVTVGSQWLCPAPSKQWIASERYRQVRVVLRDHNWQIDEAPQPWIVGDPAICTSRDRT